MKYFLTIDKIFLYRVLQSFLPLLGGVGGGLTLLVLGEGEGGEDPPPHLLQLGLLLHPATSAVKCSIGFTIGFHNHGEGPY